MAAANWGPLSGVASSSPYTLERSSCWLGRQGCGRRERVQRSIGAGYWLAGWLAGVRACTVRRQQQAAEYPKAQAGCPGTGAKPASLKHDINATQQGLTCRSSSILKQQHVSKKKHSRKSNTPKGTPNYRTQCPAPLPAPSPVGKLTCRSSSILDRSAVLSFCRGCSHHCGREGATGQRYFSKLCDVHASLCNVQPRKHTVCSPGAAAAPDSQSSSPTAGPASPSHTHLHEHQALQQEVAAEGSIPQLQPHQAAAGQVLDAGACLAACHVSTTRQLSTASGALPHSDLLLAEALQHPADVF